jgi:enamine deaminase RidA (YjgF/YER057c/UK114 family)
MADAFDLATQGEHHNSLGQLLATGCANGRPGSGRKAMWKLSLSERKPSVALTALLLAMLLASAARGGEARLSMGGYDPVAYFTDRKPVLGKPEFEYLWHRSRWRFASAEHRDMFIGDPERYAPQYDGYCALGVGGGSIDVAHKDTIDPEAWAIVNGKLYLTHNQYWLQVWREKADEHIRQGDRAWEAVSNLPEPELVGPPCAASPPSTKVALHGGGSWVIVGGQVARDEAGNLVGKSDLAAQIEQVGKNVEACLAAGGATVKDIMWTVSHVREPAEFEKYADLRRRYFGPTSPKTTTVPMSESAGPDLLLQVEAFAAVR